MQVSLAQFVQSYYRKSRAAGCMGRYALPGVVDIKGKQGDKNKWLPYPCLPTGSKGGQKCYVTTAFSGSPIRRTKSEVVASPLLELLGKISLPPPPHPIVTCGITLNKRNTAAKAQQGNHHSLYKVSAAGFRHSNR